MRFSRILLLDETFFDTFDNDWANKIFLSRVRSWDLKGHQPCLSLKVILRTAPRAYHRVGKRLISIPAAHACIVNPGQQVDSSGRSNDWLMGLSIFFDHEMVRDVFASLTEENAILAPEVDPRTQLPVFEEEVFNLAHAGMNREVDALAAGAFDPVEAYDHLAKLLMQMIIGQREYWVRLNQLPLSRTSTRVEIYRRLKKAKEILHELHDPEISIKELARHCSMTHFNFIRLFKHAFGISPFQYFDRVKIDRSQQMLRDKPELNIEDIALRLGYADHSTFGKRFKRLTGLTPSQFRDLGNMPSKKSG